jgi:putative nucleotidyltransferase with HDIG domain
MRWLRALGNSDKKQGAKMLETLQAAPASRTPEMAPDAADVAGQTTQSLLMQLPPFSPVVISLLRLFDREEVGMVEVTRLVESDSALSAELLTLVNSPLFTFRESIEDVAQSVPVVGTDRIKELATTLAMRAMLRNAPKTGVVRRLWRHSIATATIAKQLAYVYGVPGGVAHTAGMLHDVGRMGLLSARREDYPLLVLRSYDNVAEILATEHQLCGMDHCEAGIFLAKAWGFPTTLQQVALEHHKTSREKGIVSLIQAACVLADHLEFIAVSHADHITPAERLAECLTAAEQNEVLQHLPQLEARIFDEVESLDF